MEGKEQSLGQKTDWSRLKRRERGRKWTRRKFFQ